MILMVQLKKYLYTCVDLLVCRDERRINRLSDFFVYQLVLDRRVEFASNGEAVDVVVVVG